MPGELAPIEFALSLCLLHVTIIDCPVSCDYAFYVELRLTYKERGSSALASKNPFRNLIPTSASSPPLVPIGTATTNPFLDASEIASPESAAKKSPVTQNSKSKPVMPDSTIDIFVCDILH